MASSLKGTSKKEKGEGASGSRGITSYFSGILSFGNGSSVDESSTREQRTSPQRVNRPDKDLYRSLEDLSGEMDPNKKAIIMSQPKADLTSPTHRCEAQQLLQVQQRSVASEGAVLEQGRELSEVKGLQKSKKGFNWWKQASKDRDEETAKEIQDRDDQISFYRKKLDNAENLETQNLQLATELSEKEFKLEELNQQLTTLRQQMGTVLTENEKLIELANATSYRAEIQHLRTHISRLQEQLKSKSNVKGVHTDHDRGDEQTSAMKVANLQEKIVELQAKLVKATSQSLALKTDLDMAVLHSKSQSREIIDLKKKINSLKLKGRELESCRSSSYHPEQSEVALAQVREKCECLQRELSDLKLKYDNEVKQKQLLDVRRRELEKEVNVYSERAKEAEGQSSDLRSQWIIHRDEIELTSVELGRGGWGEVIVANFRGTQVAAKCFYRALNSKYYQEMFSREINMAGRLRHPNLVQFIAAFNDDGKPIILTELMTTSLRDELEQGRILQLQVTPINLDVAKALNYLHLMKPHPIVHRDISSANVLLDPIPHNRWKAKVADYGSVNLQHKLQTVNPGSPVYIAPEAFIPALQSPKMDIYSFGVLLVEMLSGKFPEASHRQHLLNSIRDAKYVSLIKQCLSEKQDSRPSAQEIIAVLSKV